MAAVPIRLGKIVTRYSTSACYVFPNKSLKNPLKIGLTRRKPGLLGLPVSLALPILRDAACGLVQPIDVVRTTFDFDAGEEFRGIGSGLA